MKFGYTIIYVQDVLKTVEFYKKAFGVKLKFLHESNQYAEMATGETTLAFASEGLAQGNGLKYKANKSDDIPAGFEIAFIASDVRAAFEKAIKEGAKEVSVPTEKPWGQGVAYVADNNGVLVEICSAMEDE